MQPFQVMMSRFNDKLELQEGRYDQSKLDAFTPEELERVVGRHPNYSIGTRKRRVVIALTVLEDRGAAPGLATQVRLHHNLSVAWTM